MNKIKRHIYELKSLAFTFTFCADFIDAYTFIERGGTLAVRQTGNIVFLEWILLIIICQGQWQKF